MTNQNLTSQEPVQTASAGATVVQSGLQSGQINCRSAFRLSAIDLNPDLVDRVDAMEAGVAYNDQAKPMHWMLTMGSLRSMIASLGRDKRTLAHWQGVDDVRTDSELAVEILGELGWIQVEYPATVWAFAKFMARFTAQFTSMTWQLQRDLAAVKRQLRRAQMA